MKTFFKNVLSTVVGVLLSSVILGIICIVVFFATIGILVSSGEKTYNLEANTILEIDLSGLMKDRVKEDRLLQYVGYQSVDEISLIDIMSAIKKAKENDKVSGIYIKSGYFSASSASLTELRDQLIDFKKSGKFVVAYADDYLQGGYYLTSIADKIIMNPQGTLDLHGISSNRTFYKGLLDKVGVEMQIFKVGTYKSAVEPYISDKMSEANREQVTSFTDNIWSTVVSSISVDRDISVDRLNLIADSLSAFKESSYILENGLVDTLLYENDVKEYLKNLVGVEESEDLAYASVSEILTVPDKQKTKTKDQIAVLYAEGSIVGGDSNDNINDGYLIKQITKLQDDEDIKAVVFRVNSPGGSAYASEQIWKAITDLKAKKPVVVSMGSYAASGGYYISCNATKIYAEPTTLTGSIGIFGMFPNIQGLTNKIGLSFDNVQTNKLADFGDVTRPMNDDEKAILQKYINRGYDLFLTRCSEGRNMSKERMNEIAQGRVWTGSQALEIGLVDELGGLNDAIKDAAKLVSLTDYSLGEYPKPVSFLESLFDISKESIATRAMKEYLGEDFELLKTMREMKELKSQDFIQARMPYEIEIR